MADAAAELSTVRILVADDHSLLRAGLRALLKDQPRLQIVGEAGEGPQALRLAEELRPDLVLLDISMPGPSGIEIARALKRILPDTVILILTAHEDPEMLRAAVAAGASGYVVKRAVESELLNAIAAALRGDLYVHPFMTRSLVEDMATDERHVDANRLDDLTPRELEVLRLVARGFTNVQIAGQMQLSVRTVESHRSNLSDKLGVRNRAELVRYAASRGLIDE